MNDEQRQVEKLITKDKQQQKHGSDGQITTENNSSKTFWVLMSIGLLIIFIQFLGSSNSSFWGLLGMIIGGLVISKLLAYIFSIFSKEKNKRRKKITWAIIFLIGSLITLMNTLIHINSPVGTEIPQAPSITNPDYLKEPAAYLVDNNSKDLSQIPTGKALWVEEIKNSAMIRVSYPTVKAGQKIIVAIDMQIPGLDLLSWSGALQGDKVDQCIESTSINFLTANLLYTVVYLSYEGVQSHPVQGPTWRLLMPAANGKDTQDVTSFIIWNGYGKKTYHPEYQQYSNDYLMYPFGIYNKVLTDDQYVASLAKRGFWGTCQ